MDESRSLALLRDFLLPGGERTARQVRGVRTRERGEIRLAPEARWMPFTAEERIEAYRSSFRWEGRFRGVLMVTDAYEGGHGLLAMRVGGFPVKKTAGPEMDRGELQRYLASIGLCPPALYNHLSLEWSEPRPHTLGVRDREGPKDASIELDLDSEGRPLRCRAVRPRRIGKQAVPAPWRADFQEFRDWEGMRAVSRFEVFWDLADGRFSYFRVEVTGCAFL